MRITKKHRQTVAEFGQYVRTVLAEFEAEPDTFYEFKVKTPAGTLLVTVDDVPGEGFTPSVMQRFKEPHKAISILGERQLINPYSGKWNHHFMGTPDDQLLHHVKLCWENNFRRLWAGSQLDEGTQK